MIGTDPCVTIAEFDRGYACWRDHRRAHHLAHGHYPPEIQTPMTTDTNDTNDNTSAGPAGVSTCTPAAYVSRENYQQPAHYWAQMFGGHQITRQGDRSLELRHPKDSNNWMTISIDDGGQLIVWGDNTAVIFGFCRTDTLMQRIAWIGSHATADPYITKKARIGSPTQKLTRAYRETFEADVREYFAELVESDEYTASTNEQLTWTGYYDGSSGDSIEALEHSSVTAIWEVGQYLRDIGCEQEIEDYHALGQRTTGDVERAHAALHRAWRLLQIEQARVDGHRQAGTGRFSGMPKTPHA